MSDPSQNDVSPQPSQQAPSSAERSVRRAQRHARQAEEGECRRQEAARQARKTSDHNRLFHKFTRFDVFFSPDPSPEDWRQKARLFVEWIEEVAAQGLQGRLREHLANSGGQYEPDALEDATDILDGAFAGDVEGVAAIMQAAQATGGPYLRSLAGCLAAMGGMVRALITVSPLAKTGMPATPAAQAGESRGGDPRPAAAPLQPPCPQMEAEVEAQTAPATITWISATEASKLSESDDVNYPITLPQISKLARQSPPPSLTRPRGKNRLNVDRQSFLGYCCQKKIEVKGCQNDGEPDEEEQEAIAQRAATERARKDKGRNDSR